MIENTPLQLAWLLLHTGLALALMWSCICRFTHTSKTNTRPSIRWAFTLMSVYAGVSLFGPFASTWQPGAMNVFALGAITCVQIVTSVHWREGVPVPFRSESERAKLDGFPELGWPDSNLPS
ncbi:MAG: hypothetical protein ACK40L_10235 [Hydrogenophaga sp.]